MVKIFVGNLASGTTVDELRNLFAQYGKISECDIVKNFGFVHMTSMSEAEEAIRNLHHYELNGEMMNVEMSKGRPKATTKLHVSNLGEGCGGEDLRSKFEEFGTVVECDIVKDYAFVHMERVEDAMEAISKLDNTAFKARQTDTSSSRPLDSKQPQQAWKKRKRNPNVVKIFIWILELGSGHHYGRPPLALLPVRQDLRMRHREELRLRAH